MVVSDLVLWLFDLEQSVFPSQRMETDSILYLLLKDLIFKIIQIMYARSQMHDHTRYGFKFHSDLARNICKIQGRLNVRSCNEDLARLKCKILQDESGKNYGDIVPKPWMILHARTCKIMGKFMSRS